MSDPRTTVTVKQVVCSAYAWGNGDLHHSEILAPEDCTDEGDGDSLLAFLLAETSPDCGWYGSDAPECDTLEHWEEARARIRTVLAEVFSVYNALHRLGPQSPGDPQ